MRFRCGCGDAIVVVAMVTHSGVFAVADDSVVEDQMEVALAVALDVY